jgi:hypothetical protein
MQAMIGVEVTVVTRSRETLATDVDAELLTRVRTLADHEGRPVGVLLEEALADLLAKRGSAEPRPAVMAAYQASHERFASLYKKLAE